MDYKHLASNVCETFETLSAEERVDFLKRITGEQYVSVTDMELQREVLSDNKPNDCDNLTDADVRSEYNGVSETQEQNQLVDKLLLDANTRIVMLDESSVSCTEPQSSKKAKKKKTKEKASSILPIQILKRDKKEAALKYSPYDSAWLISNGLITLFVSPKIQDVESNRSHIVRQTLSSVLPKSVKIQGAFKLTNNIFAYVVKLPHFSHMCLYVEKLGWDILNNLMPEAIFSNSDVSREEGLYLLKQKFKSESKTCISTILQQYYIECYKLLEYSYK